MNPNQYPQTPRIDHMDDYHGTPVQDAYRWLEDLNAPETQAWIAEQNALTFSFLASIPARERIRERLTELWDYPRTSAPFKRADRYFQFRNTGLQNQDVLYVMEAPDDEGHVLLDPNALSEDGTVALTGLSVSEDGRRLAYATSASGSDWKTWHVRDVESGEDLADAVEWSKFCSAVWLPDGSGFIYARYPAPETGREYANANYYRQLYLHRLGTPQAADTLVYERPDHKNWGFDVEITDDGDYLILQTWQGDSPHTRVFYKPLAEQDFTPLVPDLVAKYSFVGNSDTDFYFITDADASRGRLVVVDVTAPDRWQTLIPECEDSIADVVMAHDEFVVLYLHDAHHRLERFALDGSPLGEIALPALGEIVSSTVSYTPELYGNREDDELFFTFDSFLYPPSPYRYDFEFETSTPLAAPSLDFDPADYVTEQVFVTSKDGTRVPMFLVHRRDMALDGQNPTLLYGYGGFNIAQPPTFMVWRLVWLEMGGVLAVANIRGGGEYGEDWHQGGTIHNKQNVFDDFIACAEHLIDSGITSTPKLAIEGRSNGGLLVGACLTQRPDLFGAALPTVGVFDMLRFHKFTIGWAWASDYGSADDPEQFKSLYAYSPLHNARPAEYPPTLILTGDHDDRVMPAHSYKFAAALQATQRGPAPILIRIETKAGHGAGKPTHLLIAERTDMWAFLVEALNI